MKVNRTPRSNTDMPYRNDLDIEILPVILILALFVVLGIIGLTWRDSKAWVKEDQALSQFQQIAKSQNVVIVSHTDNRPFIGHPHDVTFKLTVDGKAAHGRCTSALTVPMTCKLEIDD